jgi:hypothetical protein
MCGITEWLTHVPNLPKVVGSILCMIFFFSLKGWGFWRVVWMVVGEGDAKSAR